MQNRELELDLSKVYKMPPDIYVHKLDGNFLVISPETANWLLLYNEIQIDIFTLLSGGTSVEELLNLFPDSLEDTIHVLTELEAKEFENTSVTYPQEQGLYLYLTNECNQQCKHCYMSAGKKNSDELTTVEIKKLLDDFIKLGGKVVTLTGGEATLRSDFLEVVQYAKFCNLQTCLLSNGLRLNSSFVESMCGYVDEVQISIDGYDSKSYMQTRNTDSFCQVLNSVDLLVNSGFKVAVAISPVISSLVENEKEYSEFACTLKEKYKDKNFIIKFATELFDGRDIILTEEERSLYSKVSQSIKHISQPQSDVEGFVLDHSDNKIFNNCGYGGITVSATGDIYFCNLVSECSVQANLRENTFEEIMELANKAREISDVTNLLPCKNCDLKYLCGGGCRVKLFPEIASCRISGEISPIKNIPRCAPCTQEYKDRIYNLMITSNELFYR